MKFLDFRKYFFSYFYIIFALAGMYLLWLSSTYPPPTEDEFFSDGFGPFAFGAISILAYLWCCGLLLLEILLRKFVISKRFPNLKFPFSIPKKLNLFFSTVFYILFSISCLPLLITIIVTGAVFIDDIKAAIG